MIALTKIFFEREASRTSSFLSFEAINLIDTPLFLLSSLSQDHEDPFDQALPVISPPSLQQRCH